MKTSKRKIHPSIKKSDNELSERIDKAKIAYEKDMLELTPFLPKTQSKEVTTEGNWQKTSSFSLY